MSTVRQLASPQRIDEISVGENADAAVRDTRPRADSHGFTLKTNTLIRAEQANGSVVYTVGETIALSHHFPPFPDK